MRTDSVLGRTLLNLLSDAEEGMDLARSADSEVAAVDVLAETISEKDPAHPRYQARIHGDIRKGYWSIAVTESTSGILAPTSRSWHRSLHDLRESRIDL